MAATEASGPVRVFVSYSHDSAEHMDRVLALCDRLRHNGVDAVVDQYEMSPTEGWPRWAERQVEAADFVLIVCTEIYRQHWDGASPHGSGLGVRWEGAILNQALYEAESESDGLIPVVLVPEDARHVPMVLRGLTRYNLGSAEGYEQLYRRLTHQPAVQRPQLGHVVALSARPRASEFGALQVEAGEADREGAKATSLRRGPRRARGPLSQEWQGARAAWGFSSILLAVLVGVVALDRDHLAGMSQPVLAILSGLLAGLMTYFLTGDLGLRLAWLRAGGGMGAFALAVLLWPRLLPSPALYRVGITVIGAQGGWVAESVVSSEPPGVYKRVNRTWEIDIPAVSLPADRRIRIYAEGPEDGSRAQVDVTLGSDLQPTFHIQLSMVLARVDGYVLDDVGGPVAGAEVKVIGHDEEAVRTGLHGEFSLPAHVPPGHMVQLQASKAGVGTRSQDHPAGTAPARLFLQKD